jgi:tape measure domain-containing protein
MPDLAQLNIIVDSSGVQTANSRLLQFVNASQTVVSVNNRLTQVFKSSSSAAQDLSNSMGRLLGAFSGFAVVRRAFSVASELEQTELAFQTFFKSAEEAAKKMREIKALALENPIFAFGDLSQAARTMTALGVASDDLLPSIKAVANAATALGTGEQGMQRISLALGQILTKNRVQAEEVTRQLANAGIKGWQYLADAAQVSVTEVQKIAEAGGLNAKAAVQAILYGMQEDFEGTSQRAKNSLKAIWTGLKENIDFVLADFVQALEGATSFKAGFRFLIDNFKYLAIVTSDTARVLLGLQPQFAANEKLARLLADAIQTIAISVGVVIGLQAVSMFAGMAREIFLAATATDKASTSMKLLMVSLAAVVGYEIGRWAYENFQPVQEFGSHAIETIQKLQLELQQAAENFKIIGRAFKDAFLGDGSGSFLDQVSANNAKYAAEIQKVAEIGRQSRLAIQREFEDKTYKSFSDIGAEDALKAMEALSNKARQLFVGTGLDIPISQWKQQIDESLKAIRDSDPQQRFTQPTRNELLNGEVEAKLEKVGRQLRRIRTFADDVGEAFARNFEDAILHVKSFGDAMRSLLEDISRLVIRQTVTAPLAGLVSQLTGGFLNMFGGGGFNPVAAGSQAAVGAGFSAASAIAPIPKFASGGVFNSPHGFMYGGGRMGVLGERGPEAVMPLSRTADGRLGVAGGGGSTVNVNVYGVQDVAGFKASERQIAARMARAVRQS